MDITKCSCQECPIKNSCLRFTAKPSMQQSYFTEHPCEWHDDWFYCEYFWNNKPEPETLFEKHYNEYLNDLINSTHD